MPNSKMSCGSSRPRSRAISTTSNREYRQQEVGEPEPGDFDLGLEITVGLDNAARRDDRGAACYR